MTDGELKYGLTQKTVELIQNCLAANPKVEEAVLYGSRAKGNFRRGSDINLVLKGEKLHFKDVLLMEVALDELMLPYKLDISVWHQIDNLRLREHINRIGISSYSRTDPKFHKESSR